MNIKLEGKRALVTGGNSGLGAAVSGSRRHGDAPAFQIELRRHFEWTPRSVGNEASIFR
jgi:hypothetical protein